MRRKETTPARSEQLRELLRPGLARSWISTRGAGRSGFLLLPFAPLQLAASGRHQGFSNPARHVA